MRQANVFHEALDTTSEIASPIPYHVIPGSDNFLLSEVVAAVESEGDPGSLQAGAGGGRVCCEVAGNGQ